MTLIACALASLWMPAVLSTATPSAGHDQGLSSYVRSSIPKISKAYKTSDSRYFESLLSPDFRSKDSNGVVQDRKESLFVLRYQLNTVKVTDCKVDISAIQPTKTGGVVTNVITLIGLTKARGRITSEPIRIVRKVTDTYRKQGSSWQLVYRVEPAAPLIKVGAGKGSAPGGMMPMQRMSPPRNGPLRSRPPR